MLLSGTDRPPNKASDDIPHTLGLAYSVTLSWVRYYAGVKIL
jgi:hypothetical protein